MEKVTKEDGEYVRPKNNMLAEGRMAEHTEGKSYPSLGMSVWIEGNCFRNGAVEMFYKADCLLAESPETADLICFLGGEDINPKLYGEKAHRSTYFNDKRDDREMDVWIVGLSNKIPMMGICRGMQLIHALNGGKLYQDVDNHTRAHIIVDCETGEEIMSSSMHHQMCQELVGTIPIAYAKKGTCMNYREFEKSTHTDSHKDLEACVYPDTLCIAFQGHPEVGGYPEYTKWCLNRTQEFCEAIEMKFAAFAEERLAGIGHNSGEVPPRLKNVTPIKELPMMQPSKEG